MEYKFDGENSNIADKYFLFEFDSNATIRYAVPNMESVDNYFYFGNKFE